MVWVILLILWAVITYTHPWIDSYTDYIGGKHTVLWYTNFKGERKFINLIGDQKWPPFFVPMKCPKCKKDTIHVKCGMFCDLYICDNCGYETYNENEIENEIC